MENIDFDNYIEIPKNYKTNKYNKKDYEDFEDLKKLLENCKAKPNNKPVLDLTDMIIVNRNT